VFQGNINAISFKKKTIYKPTASLVIHLNINKTDLGDLKFDIEGTKIWRVHINSFLENENFESFNAFGNFQIIDKETFLDMKLKFVI
jgi:hypothetical protein